MWRTEKLGKPQKQSIRMSAGNVQAYVDSYNVSVINKHRTIARESPNDFLKQNHSEYVKAVLSFVQKDPPAGVQLVASPGIVATFERTSTISDVESGLIETPVYTEFVFAADGGRVGEGLPQRFSMSTAETLRGPASAVLLKRELPVFNAAQLAQLLFDSGALVTLVIGFHIIGTEQRELLAAPYHFMFSHKPTTALNAAFKPVPLAPVLEARLSSVRRVAEADFPGILESWKWDVQVAAYAKSKIPRLPPPPSVESESEDTGPPPLRRIVPQTPPRREPVTPAPAPTSPIPPQSTRTEIVLDLTSESDDEGSATETKRSPAKSSGRGSSPVKSSDLPQKTAVQKAQETKAAKTKFIDEQIRAGKSREEATALWTEKEKDRKREEKRKAKVSKSPEQLAAEKAAKEEKARKKQEDNDEVARLVALGVNPRTARIQANKRREQIEIDNMTESEREEYLEYKKDKRADEVFAVTDEVGSGRVRKERAEALLQYITGNRPDKRERKKAVKAVAKGNVFQPPEIKQIDLASKKAIELEEDAQYIADATSFVEFRKSLEVALGVPWRARLTFIDADGKEKPFVSDEEDLEIQIMEEIDLLRAKKPTLLLRYARAAKAEKQKAYEAEKARNPAAVRPDFALTDEQKALFQQRAAVDYAIYVGAEIEKQPQRKTPPENRFAEIRFEMNELAASAVQAATYNRDTVLRRARTINEVMQRTNLPKESERRKDRGNDEDLRFESDDEDDEDDDEDEDEDDEEEDELRELGLEESLIEDDEDIIGSDEEEDEEEDEDEDEAEAAALSSGDEDDVEGVDEDDVEADEDEDAASADTGTGGKRKYGGGNLPQKSFLRDKSKLWWQ
jgi:hypothetical protein